MSRLVYVASALGEWQTARAIASQVRALESFDVASKWHDIVGPGSTDPASDSARSEILLANIADLERARCMIAYCAAGNPAATYCEIGYAIASCKPVIWIAGIGMQGRCTFDAHSSVSRVSTVPEALMILRGMRWIE